MLQRFVHRKRMWKASVTLALALVSPLARAQAGASSQHSADPVVLDPSRFDPKRPLARGTQIQIANVPQFNYVGVIRP